MADLSVELAELNANARELLKKHDRVFTKLEELSTQKQTEIEKIITTKQKEIDTKVQEGLKAIDDILKSGRVAEAENALKLGGKKLLATVNADGSFNDDGIFKIKNVNGVKTLVGILDTQLSAIPTATPFDIFGDGSRIALFEFEGNTNDTGGVYNGTPTGITYTASKFGQAVKSSTSSQVKISNLPFDENTEVVTISAWINWNGTNSVMPFGWYKYDIWFYGGNMGFNTGNGDVYGIPSSGFVNTWRHIVAEFRKGAYGKIWIDGVPQTLSQKRNSIDASSAIIGSKFHVFGWGYDSSYRNFGMVDQVSIINRALTDAEVQILYNEGR